MKVAVFKVRTENFDDIESGARSFDILKNKPMLRVNDVIVYQEVETLQTTLIEEKTGREMLKKVAYMTDFMQRSGYVVFGLVPVTYNDLNAIFDDKKSALLMLGYDYETVRKMPVDYVDKLYAREQKKGFEWEKSMDEN